MIRWAIYGALLAIGIMLAGAAYLEYKAEHESKAIPS